MKITCISDLHGNYPKLSGGDLLIVAGDLTAQDRPTEYNVFSAWIKDQLYRKRIVIAGNHDNWIQSAPFSIKTMEGLGDFTYLCDSGTEFEGLKIWGSPWTKTFPGMNPKCKAFTCENENDLAEKWALIPDDVTILVTHSPSFGNFDWVYEADGRIGASVGSLTLWFKMLSMIPKLKVHVCGHIHEAYGQAVHANGIHLINASHVNQDYKPVNAPINLEI